MTDIIVIGGGAAGLMAATAAAEHGSEVVVLEKNPECGRKILATGNGKCNFTNISMTSSCFNTGNPRRVKKIISQFDNGELIDFFASIGIPEVCRRGWYYPMSNSAESVQKALVSHARSLGVGLKGGKTVTDIRKTDDHFDVYVGDYAYQAKRVILSTGGLAAPKSGSTGDGLSFLEKNGLHIRKPLPSLVPLVIKDNPLKKAAGVRYDAKVTLEIDNAITDTAAGNLQITEYGISGIPVFQISSEAVRALDEGADVAVVIDFLYVYDKKKTIEVLDKNISASSALRQSDPAYLLLTGIFPEKLAQILIGSRATIGEYAPDTEELASRIKHFSLQVKGSRGFDYAQTTSGGVTFDEINDDLSLKKIPGLYVCGELMDAAGICGGYNLQWAFSSGHLAGTTASFLQ